MTAPQDEFAQVARRGAITAAVRTWTDDFQSMDGGGNPVQSGLPSPQQVLDNVFDCAEQLLVSHREFATHLRSAASDC